MAFKTFLNFYAPDDDSLFRLVEMPEDLYDAIESNVGIMPGMQFPAHSVCDSGIYVQTQDIELLDDIDAEIFLAWPAIEPVEIEERKLFRMAMTDFAEYNKWLEVAVTPSWAN